MDFQNQPEKKVFIREGEINQPEEAKKENETGALTQGEKTAKEKRAVRILDSIITISFMAIFFGVPLFFVGLAFQGIAFEKQIYFYFWTLLALVAWAVKGVVSGEMKIRKTPLDIPVLAFWLAYLLSTIFSVDRWHSFWGFFGDPSRGLINVTALVIFYYLAFSHLNLKRFKLMFGSLVVSGMIVLAWSFLGVLGIKFFPAKFSGRLPFSLLGSTVGLGIFIGLLLPLFITAVFKIAASEKTAKIIKTISIALLLIFILIALFLHLAVYNFIFWPAVLVGMALFLIYIISRVVRSSSGWTWLPMAVFVVVLVMLWAGRGVNVARIELPREAMPSFQTSWEISKDSLNDKFILGSGPAAYGYDFSLHKPQEYNLSPFNLYNLRFYQGRGIIFEAVSTIGALGTFLLLVVILSFLSVEIYLLTREKAKDKIYSLGLLAAAIVFLINAFAYPVGSANLIIGSLLGTVALFILLEENDSEKKHLALSLKASPKFALALGFVFIVVSAGVAFLFVFIGKAFTADVYAGMAARENKISEEGSINKLIKAIRLYGKEGRYYTRIGQEYLILANDEALKGEGKNITLIQKYLNNAIEASVQGKKLMENDVLAAEFLAQLYENSILYVPQAVEKSEEFYQRALELEPHNPDYYLKLGQIKSAVAAGKEGEEKKQLVEEAKNFFQQSIDKKNNYAAGYYNLAVAQEALGDLEQAIINTGKAASLESNNVNYFFNLGRLYQLRGKEGDYQIAEKIFKDILSVNANEANTRFNLAFLYEKMDKKDDAIAEYRKVIELIPDDKAAKEKVEDMIKNVESGKGNIQKESGEIQPVQQPSQ